MRKIAIMTDSSADITREEAVKENLFVMRLPLVIDKQDFVEEETISLEGFTKKMYDGSVCKTSQAVLGELLSMWKEILREYDEILYIPISSGLSGSYNSAALAAEAFEGKVTVVDAKFVCYPLQWLCLEAQKMVEQGYEAKAIKDKIEHETWMWAALIPESLEYLKRGGRISAGAAALGNLLKIVPILKVENGAIDVLNKVRTAKKAWQVALAENGKEEHPEDFVWMIVEADMKEEAIEMKAALEEIVHQPVTIHPMHPTIMSHTGPRTVGIGKMKKLNY